MAVLDTTSTATRRAIDILEYLRSDSTPEFIWDALSEVQVSEHMTESLGDVIVFADLSRPEKNELLDRWKDTLAIDDRTHTHFTSEQQISDFLWDVWFFCTEKALGKLAVMGSMVESSVEYGVTPDLKCSETGHTLVYVTAGELMLEGRDVARSLKPHDAVLIAPSSEVFIRVPDDGAVYEWYNSIFIPQASWSSYMSWQPSGGAAQVLHVEHKETQEQIVSAFEQFIGYAHSLNSRRYDLKINAHEQILLLLSSVADAGNQSPPDKRLQAACNYIRSNYDKNIKREDVCRTVNCSQSTLVMLFKAEFGVGIMRWRDDLRMQEANRLLRESNLPIAEVGRQVGYEDPLFFSRRFKALRGSTPSKARNTAQSVIPPSQLKHQKPD